MENWSTGRAKGKGGTTKSAATLQVGKATLAAPFPQAFCNTLNVFGKRVAYFAAAAAAAAVCLHCRR